MTQLSAPIVAVTVYPGQARLTRRGRAWLAPGTHEVQLVGLPLGIDSDSVRVSGRGPLTITGVEVSTWRRAQTGPEDPAHELLAEQRRLTRVGLELDDRRAVLVARQKVLDGLTEHAGRTFATRLASADASTSSLSEIGDYLTAELTAVLQQLRELTVEQAAHRDQVDRVNRELDELRDGTPDRRSVLIEVDVTPPTHPDGQRPDEVEVELEVSYLVAGATWTPRYDARLVDDTLTVTWFGMVSQRTGEDWPSTELRLSTARPGAALTIPELDPWYLDDRPPGPPPVPIHLPYGAPAPMAFGGAPDGAAPATMLRAGLKADAPAAEMLTAAVEHTETASTYRVTRPVPVACDGSDHQVMITNIDLPAAIDRITAPVRGEEVYLRAKVTNTSEHTLRPGRAALFHGPEFVGSTHWQTWAPGEELELALGLDDRIRVERELTHRVAGKTRLGGSRRHEARYRISVTNYGQTRAGITVLDQIPVSRSADITVKDVTVSPRTATISDLGEVCWQLDLDPGERRELTLGFVADSPRQLPVIGWRD